MHSSQSLLAKNIREYLLNGTCKRIRQSEFAEIVSVSEQTVSKWVRSLAYPSNENPFLDKLGWSPELLRECRNDYAENFKRPNREASADNRVPELQTSVTRNSEYQALSFSDYLANFNDVDSLNKEIDDIIANYPIPDIEGNDMGLNEKWKRIFALSSDTGCVLIDRNESIVGFWFFAIVTSNTYEQIIRGENVNKKIEICDIKTLEEPGEYDAYFVDFFIHPSHFSPLAKQILFKGFFALFQELAEIDVYINRLSANITTDLAESFCIHRGFKFLCNHKTHLVDISVDELEPSKIYELDFTKEFGRTIFRNNTDLEKRYRDHFN
jgi:transcriptional regulator with XRE-family HTH domain